MKLVPPSIVSEVSTTPTRSGAGGKGQARPAGCEAKREPLPGHDSACGQSSATNPGVRACRAAGPAAPLLPAILRVPSPLACASLGRALLVWCLDGASRTLAGAYRPVSG